MFILLSAPICLLFLYVTYRLIRRRLYREAALFGALSLVLLVVTLGFVGLGYLWSTAPMEVTL